MPTDYLPKHAKIELACAWLHANTGETWTLARLLEHGLMPWFWLDYSPGLPDLFGNRIEGFLAPMLFAGDTQRLAVDDSDALVSMTRTHDGKICKIQPSLNVALSELRFLREDIERLADRRSHQRVEGESATTNAGASNGQEYGEPEPLDSPTMARVLDGVGGKDAAQWRKALGEQRRKWKIAARVSPGLRGRQPATWNPVCLVALMQEKGVMNSAEAQRLFKTKIELEPWAAAWRQRDEKARWYGING